MRLPQLRVLKDAPTPDFVSCSQHDYCSSCTLFVKNGGRCEGCSQNHRAAMKPEFQWCQQQCHSCTGYKSTVTAVCCRSPLKNLYLDAVTKNPSNWNAPSFTYTERPLLQFKRKAIFYIGQKCNAKNVLGDALAGHEVVATNMKVVVKANGKGFQSGDLHDYLSLSKHTKIVLTSMDLDEHLERAWEEEFYLDPGLYESVGVSYWMPLAFSAYGDSDARMHRYYQLIRTLRCMESSKAHFVPAHYRAPGLRIDDLLLEVINKVPNLIFNAQFIGAADSDSMKTTLLAIKSWHAFAPAHCAFWIVGASTPAFFANVRKIVGERDVYFVSGKPLYMALYGQAMREDGNERDLSADEQPTKPELVQTNFKMFRRLVKTWNREL